MSEPSRMASTRLALNIGSYRMEATVTVPANPVPLGELLPLLQDLDNRLVAIAEQVVRDEGKEISCRAGCGACCRQLVPISEVEAHAIADLIDSMPPPRRDEIGRRFAAARDRLDAAGLLGRIENPTQITGEESDELGGAYFRLAIACPFLEDESCSIHPDRPMCCREYLTRASPATLD